MNTPRLFSNRPPCFAALLATMALLQLACAANAATNLVAAGSTWRYLANGTGPNASWTTMGFDDSAWLNGVAKLGFGGDGEVTTIGFATNAYTTFYFRKTFTVTGAASMTNLFSRLVRDDGAVVYLNGVEAFRNNMPTGAINRLTLALAALVTPEETRFVTNALSPALLLEGANVVAVEIHQSATNSPDLGFELQLIANSNLVLPPLAVAITNAPASSNLVVGSTATIEASASGPAGIARVDFLVNGRLQGSDASVPYSLALPNIVAGSYTVVAVAVDYGGLSVTSAPAQFTVALEPGVITLVSRRSCWKYWDLGTLPDPNWQNAGYEDGQWLTGSAEFGYGDGDEDTVVSFGADATNKFVTTYFRRMFAVGDYVNYTNLILRVKRDDGVIGYLNGTEVFRNNMPAGPVGYGTFASADAADDGATYFVTNINASLLAPGENFLALEVHQFRTNSSDISFDAELLGQAAAIMPALSIAYLPLMGNAVELTWPASATTAFRLKRSLSVGPTSDWQFVTNTPVLTNGQYLVVETFSAGSGFYRLMASNAVMDACQPPLIVAQTGVTRVPVGTNVTLSVTAVGPGPFTYAWRKNGSGDLSPGNSLSFTNVQRSDGGAYDAIVGNDCACQTTCPMLLVVGGTNVVLADNFAARTTLTNSAFQLNTSNTLATAEVGEPVIPPGMFNRSLWLQWTAKESGIAVFDTAGSAQGTALAVYTGNALNALTVAAVSGKDFPAASSRVVFNAEAGTSYQVQVIGGGGSTPFLCLNGQLTATTNAAPQIIQQPQSEYVLFGSNAALTVVAVLPPAFSNGIITYQWFKEQVALPGETNSTLAITSMAQSNIAQYFVRAAFGTNSVQSAPASITGVTQGLVGQGSISPPLSDFGVNYSCGGSTVFARCRLYYFRVPANPPLVCALPCSPNSQGITDPFFQPATVTSGSCTALQVSPSSCNGGTPVASTRVTFSTVNAANAGFDTGLYIWRFKNCNENIGSAGTCYNNTNGLLESALTTFGTANNALGLIKVFVMHKLPVPNGATSVQLDYTYCPP